MSDQAEQRWVFLASPYGQVGGGMGSIMNYLTFRTPRHLQGFELLRVETHGGSRVRSIFVTAVAAWKVIRYGREKKLAILHLNVAERGSIWRKAALLAAAKLTGVKTLVHLHAAELGATYERMSGVGKWVTRALFQKADHVIVLGDIWRSWLSLELDVPSENISVVRNGVPQSGRERVQRMPGEPFRLLFLGSLSERKGVSDLLRAVSNVPKEVPVRLTLAGGGDIDHYRAISSALEIPHEIRFTGWVATPEAERLMAEADALVLPSYHEGLPLVILEALAAGVPVITTPVGAIPEVLRDGHTARLVGPGDYVRLAEEITMLAMSPVSQAHYATNGRNLYEREFTVERFADQIEAIYRKLAPA